MLPCFFVPHIVRIQDKSAQSNEAEGFGSED